VSQSEMDIINKIRSRNDPDLALKIATEIVIAYLTQKESSQSQQAYLLPEPCATI
jgi:hypothetical protein